MLRAYNNFCVKFPVFSQSVTFATLVSIGDTAAQRVIEKRTKQDWERTGRFALLNFFIVGPGIKLWYNQLERTFVGTSKLVPLKKMLADQGLFAPFMNALSMVSLELLKQKTPAQAVDQLKVKYYDVITNNYKIWPAAQIINFYLVPAMYRTVFACVVSVFWNIYFTWKLEQKAIDAYTQKTASKDF